MIILTRLQVNHFKSLQNIDLVFPRQGSILVEGLNEAGKSTLFEAVYCALYGEPLVGEETGNRGRAAYDGAIRYHADAAWLRLELDVAGTLLTVERTLRAKGANRAKLTVARPGEAVEEVNTVRAVNERLLQELGNLDKEALLNSCFVEQKKLSKLEDLGTTDRRRSLEHLLNLDKLQQLHDEFKLTRQDDSLLETLRRRAELAHAQAQVPVLETTLTDLGRRLMLVSIHEALARTAQHTANRDELARQQAALTAEREQVQGVQRRITALKRLQPALVEVTGFRAQVTQATMRLEETTAALAELDRQEQVELPALRDRQQRLQTLDALLATRQQRTSDLQRTEREIAARQADLDAIDRRTALAAELSRKIADMQVRIDRQRAAISADEAAALAQKAEATARQAALQQVAAQFDPLRDAEYARQQAAQALARAVDQAADYAALQDRLQTAADTARADEAAANQANEAYAQAQQVAEQIRTLVATQQAREQDHRAAVVAVTDAERALAHAQEEVTRQEHIHAAIQQTLATLEIREDALRAAIADHDAARQARIEIAGLMNDQQQREQEYTHAQAAATQAAATAAAATEWRVAFDAAVAGQEARATEVQAAETAHTAAQQALTTARTVRALTAWLQARRAEEALARGTAAHPAEEGAVDAAETQLAAQTRSRAAAQRRVLGLAAAGGALILTGIALLVLNLSMPAGITLVLLGLGLGAAVLRAARGGARVQQEVVAAQQAVETARRHVAQVAAERKAAEALGGGAARLAEAAAELRALDVPIPASIVDAETRLAADGMSGDVRAAEAEVTRCRTVLDAARARLHESTLKYSLLKNQEANHAGSIDPSDLKGQVATLAAAVQTGRETLATRAQILFPPDLGAPEDWAAPAHDGTHRAALDDLVETRRAALDAARQAQTAAQTALEVLAR
ncbi:MAG TPA: AAA family ATPase, partial [Chloroflexia bacterium]